MIVVIGIIGIVATFAGVLWLLWLTGREPRDEAPGPHYSLPSPPSRRQAESSSLAGDAALMYLLLSSDSDPTPAVAPLESTPYEAPVDHGSSHSCDHGSSSHDHGSNHDLGGGFDGGSSGGFD